MDAFDELLDKATVQDNDVVIGQSSDPGPTHVGNVNFKNLISEAIGESIQAEQAYDQCVDTIVDRFLAMPGNEDVEFYFACPNGGRVARMPPVTPEGHPNPILKQLVRQIVSDVFMEERWDVIQYDYSPNNRFSPILNHVEWRILFFSRWPRGTVPNLVFRLFEEVPGRDEILDLVVVQNPSPADLLHLSQRNINSIDVATGIVRLRYYVTQNTYGALDIQLSEELHADVYDYVTFVGNHPDHLVYGYQNILYRFLFADYVDLHFLDLVLDDLGVQNYAPFPIAENVISSWRKMLSSLCFKAPRTKAGHIDYKNGNSSFPSYNQMADLQLHSRKTAKEYYTFPTLPLLKVPTKKKATCKKDKVAVTSKIPKTKKKSRTTKSSKIEKEESDMEELPVKRPRKSRNTKPASYKEPSDTFESETD
jgi:hypothetical protein